MSLTPINIPTVCAVPLVYTPFSPTPNFTFAPGYPRIQAIILFGDVTSSTIDAAQLPPGAVVIFFVQQDAVGGRAFNWPVNFQGAQPIAAGPGQTTMQAFTWTGKTFNSDGVPQIF